MARNTASTSKQRRAAQRKLAKEIRTGTYKPSSAGKAYRKAVERKKDLVKEVYDLKKGWYGDNPNWNRDGWALKELQGLTETELRKLRDQLESWVDDPSQYDTDMEGADYENPVFHYH